MTKEEKIDIVNQLVEDLNTANVVYLADVSELEVEKTNVLRRECFGKAITLKVVKNTLLKKAMERVSKDMSPLYEVLHGSTAMLLCEQAKEPAKLIKEFNQKYGKPVFKGAFIQESCYIGENQLDILINIKSKEELIGDVISLLQSPAKNVLSALQSGGAKLSGIVKTLSER